MKNRNTAIPVIITILALSLTALSYAQFSQPLYIGSPAAGGNSVETGELDVGIYMWMGLGGTYAKVTPLLKIYSPPVYTTSFSISNAYPGYGSTTASQPNRMLAIVVVKNTGTIPAKVESIVWDVPPYVTVSSWGGDIPEEMIPELVNAINEADIPEDAKKELIDLIQGNKNCMHPGLVLLPGKKDVFIFNWKFEDGTPENTAFTGTATVIFKQVNDKDKGAKCGT